MIALTAAMQPEIGFLKSSITEQEIIRWSNWEFIIGRLGGREVVAVKTGIGKVLAAAVTQKIIDQFSPSAIIMSGIGGSINPEIRRGDLVIGMDCVQHDFDSTEFGFRRGHIPHSDYHIIPSDPNLVRTALLYKKEPLKTGRILTGDQFITRAHEKEFEYLRNELNGDIVEMEGAAAGLTALINDVPFLIIRVVSDNADGESKGSYRKFVNTASERSFHLIEHILMNLE